MGYDLLERNRCVKGPQSKMYISNLLAACVCGASIICIDILIRQFPGKKNFRIQDSDSFLSASLSLSFGVMVRFASLDTLHAAYD
jgi:hypothetical protein